MLLSLPYLIPKALSNPYLSDPYHYHTTHTQVLLSLPAAHAPGTGLGALVGHFEQQLLASPSKKKRRELLKELLKAVDRGRGGPSGAGSAGGAGAAGAGARGVLDIRRRMTVRFAPSPVKDARAGLLGAGGDFDLSAFVGD